MCVCVCDNVSVCACERGREDSTRERETERLSDRGMDRVCLRSDQEMKFSSLDLSFNLAVG